MSFVRKIQKVVDRVGLGLIYAFVFLALPVSALNFLNRTV
jgi:hypothetical protein